MTTPIIFTHYGFSPYLSRTLRCAALTNSDSRRILIGDQDNREVALQCGWEHFASAEVTSDLRSEFGQVFRPVKGKRHPVQINGGDYLKYVFERWFIVEKFCRDLRINDFWHFDSDVMLLEPLEQFASLLRAQGFDYTKQCCDCCLSGFVSSGILPEFCAHTISLFRDEDFLRAQQEELDAAKPNHAFTEMAAFDLFSKVSPYRGCHLAKLASGWWFDDAICLEQGFQMSPPNRYAKTYRSIKNVEFDGEGFWGCRHGEHIRFAELNCSWVHLGVFDWILGRIEGRSKGERPGRSAIGDVKPTLRQSVRYCIRDVKSSVGRLFHT
jgi:hypothetical protein